jgi:biopolymer transport protein ExbB/TolQ
MTPSKEENKLLLDNLTPAIAAARQSTGIRTQNDFTGRGRRRPLSHLAILTGILLPLAIVPYFLARRRIFSLRQKVGEMESKLIFLEKQLDKAVAEASHARHEQVKMRGSLHEIMQEADEMRQESLQRTMKQAQTNQAVQADLRRLLDETQRIR